jgi:hypothetical protein
VPSSTGAESDVEEGGKSMEIGRLLRYGVLSLRKISIALTILGQATWWMVGKQEAIVGRV